MTVVTAYAGGYTNQTGAASWANQANAQGSGAATFANWNSLSANVTGSIDYNGFGAWAGIPAGAIINNVTVTIKGYINNNLRMLAPQAQLYVGTTAKGTLQTFTTSSTSTNVYTAWVLSDVSLADLQSNTALIRFTARKANSTSSGVQYIDYFKIDVDYSDPPTGLHFDPSSPAVATSATATVQSASFTPPAGNTLILVRWAADSGTTAVAPTITDSLVSHLTYTPVDWQSYADTPGRQGQAATWVAQCTSTAARTVSVTTGDSGVYTQALRVQVIQHVDGTMPGYGAHGKAGSGALITAIAQGYTAQADAGWGFIAICDYAGNAAQVAGTGTSTDGSALANTAITYGFFHRTSPDDVNGAANTLNVTVTNGQYYNWTWVELIPGSSTTPVSSSDTGVGTDVTTGLSRPATDTGGGTDLVTARSETSYDPASGGDALNARSLVDGDAGTGTDLVVLVELAKSGADTATGTDLVTALGKTSTETGTGSETVSARSLPAADPATATDTVALYGPGAVETGTGTDTVALYGPGAVETGTGIETVSARSLPAADPATATDTLTLHAPRSTETATGTDTVALYGPGAVETGTGAEAVSARDTPVTDAGTGTETVLACDSGSNKAVSESVAATDTVSNLSKTGAEQGTGTDAAVLTGITSAEAVTSNEAIAARELSNGDTAAGTDTGQVNQGPVPKSDTETGTGAESTLAKSSVDTESLSGAELVKAWFANSVDVGSGNESVTARSDTSSDTGAGAETVSARTQSVVDTASASDDLQQVVVFKVGSDGGTGTDSTTTRDTGVADSAIATEDEPAHEPFDSETAIGDESVSYLDRGPALYLTLSGKPTAVDARYTQTGVSAQDVETGVTEQRETRTTVSRLEAG